MSDCFAATAGRLAKALANHEYVAAILMDLSKAFDCLPHDLHIAKLQANGLSSWAIKLLGSYLSRLEWYPIQAGWTTLLRE